MKGFYTFCLLIVSVTCDCPNGYTRHDDFCYDLVRVKASWAEAVVYCQSVGAQLARVESDTVNLFMKNWLTQESGTIATGGVWLAGLDYLVEGEWQWAFSGDKMKKTYWAPGMPDNVNGAVGQDCLSMWKPDHYQWNDDQCSDQNYFVCEREVQTGSVIG